MTGARRSRDWQKTDPHLRRHPMFSRFTAALGCSTTEAHGILAGVWAFAFDFAHDGDLSRFTAEDIALAIEWDGDAGELWSALSIGFLEKGTLHHWHEWGGALFFTRKTDAERKWDERNSDKQEKVSKDVQGLPGTIRDNAPEKKREEKKREEKSIDQGQVPSAAENPAAPPKVSAPKVKTPKIDEWADRATALLDTSSFPSDLMQLAEIMAAENKSGVVSMSRVVRELYGPLVEMESEFSAEAMRHGLRAALSCQAPNANYVKKAAAKYKPGDNGNGRRDTSSSLDTLQGVYDSYGEECP